MTSIQRIPQRQQAPPPTDPPAGSGFRGLRAVATPKAIWRAIAVVALLQASVYGLRWSFVSSETRPLRHALADLPQALGPWNGKEITMDKRIVDAVAADELVDRSYEASDGTRVTVSSAVWLSPTEWVPHRPPLCYAANGWKTVRSELVPLPGHKGATIALDTYEQSGERVVVGYWYQLEELTYLDRGGARGVRATLWGRRQWSPLIKTLLQTPETDGAQSKVVDIASRIYDFNCGI